MLNEAKFQVGKNKLTEGSINSINLLLKNHKQVRISILKSAERNRDEINKMAESIKEKVAFSTSYRIIGFTIILRKQSNKPKRTQ